MLKLNSRIWKKSSHAETSFAAVIEQLESDKIRLTAELIDSKNQVTKAIASKELAEDEGVRLRSIIQAADLDRQLLQQQMQDLRGMIAYFKDTTRTAVDDFIARLKLDLGLFTGN